MKRSRTVVYWHAEFRVSYKFKFPCENKKKISPFLDSNQDVADALLLYRKKTVGCPNFLEGMFHCFRDKVVPNLLKLMNSPSLTNHKYIASFLEDEERDEAKNTPAIREKQLIIKETDGLITKESLFLRHGIRCVCSSTINSWVHRLGFRYETRKKNTR